MAFGVIMLLMYRRLRGYSPVHGYVFVAYSTFYALFRFLCEFLRGDERSHVLGLSTPQLVSAASFMVGAIFILKTRHFGAPDPEPYGAARILTEGGGVWPGRNRY